MAAACVWRSFDMLSECSASNLTLAAAQHIWQCRQEASTGTKRAELSSTHLELPEPQLLSEPQQTRSHRSQCDEGHAKRKADTLMTQCRCQGQGDAESESLISASASLKHGAAARYCPKTGLTIFLLAASPWGAGHLNRMAQRASMLDRCRDLTRFLMTGLSSSRANSSGCTQQATAHGQEEQVSADAEEGATEGAVVQQQPAALTAPRRPLSPPPPPPPSPLPSLPPPSGAAAADIAQKLQRCLLLSLCLSRAHCSFLYSIQLD